MPEISVSLTLTFTTPPSVGAGGVSGTLADKVATRNARNEFIIPASQVKGKLRHACEQLLRGQDVPLCRPPKAEEMCPNADGVKPFCLLCQIFGSPGHPSNLRFHDLVVRDANLLPEETLRWMVSLNRRRRTAEARRLFVVETAPHVNKLQFANAEAITGHIDNPNHLHILLAGLKMLFSWGGGTSRGLGWGTAQTSGILDGKTIEFKAKEVKALCQSSTAQ